jgi:hypothetical protein
MSRHLPLRLFFAALILLVLHACERDNGSITYCFTGLELEPASTANGEPEVSDDTLPRGILAFKLNLFPKILSDTKYYDNYETSVSDTNPITGIRIWSDQDYNEIPAGGTLNTKFSHFMGDYFHVAPLTDDGTIEPTALYYDDFADQHVPLYTYLLAEEPPAAGDYTFYVRLFFDDDTFVTDTLQLHLLP